MNEEILKIKKQIQSLEREKKKDYEAISDTYLALCIKNKGVSDWLKGIEAAENSIKMAKKIKNKYIKNFKISKANEEIGTIYKVIEEYEKAIEYFDIALNVIDKNIVNLIKVNKKLSPEEYIKHSTLTKSLYVDCLKQKIEVLLTLKDEKKATECISKPFNKYLKTKDTNYLEIMTYLADMNIYLAKKLKNIDLIIRGIGEFIILDFIAKKFSEDKKYWKNKIHRDIREKSKMLLETFNMPVDEKILGRETLNILKQIELETKDHMYIDKLLTLKKKEEIKENIEELLIISEAIEKDEASNIVLAMAKNDLIMSLAQDNRYTEAIQKAKEVLKDIKKIKNKNVKDFLSGAIQLNLFRVYVRRQDYKQAEKEAKKAIEHFEAYINTIAHACFTMLELASCYIVQNRFDKAESMLEKPIEVYGESMSAEFLARLYELLGGIKLKIDDHSAAAVYFGISALFYLISDDQNKYREFLTLAIKLYNQNLKSLGFSGIFDEMS